MATSNKRNRNVVFRYDPQPNMTAWELARFIAVLKSESVLHFEFYLNLPEPLRRHFRQINHAR